MTLQKIYQFSANVSPAIHTVYDDEYFEFVYEIPNNQKTIQISNNNPVYILDNPLATTTCPSPSTSGLTGTLVLSSSSVELYTNPNVISYYSGCTNNSIIFTYITDPLLSKRPLKIGDMINNHTITKVIDRFGHLCYAEFTSGTNIFNKNTNYTTDSNITVNVKSGYGIIDTAGIIGKLNTEFKEIYYFAKFSIPNGGIRDSSSTVDFKTFKIADNINSIKTPTDERWNAINSDIINPNQTSQSEIQAIPGITITNPNTNIDGTSDLSAAIKINSFMDVPTKTSEVSYGISDFRPQNNRNDLLGPIELPIVLNFNRVYTGIPVVHTNTQTSTIIDGWLIHTWNAGYSPTTSSGSGSGGTVTTCDDPDYTEPVVIYNKINGNISKISAFGGTGAGHKELVLFANNDLLVKSGIHTLDLTTEPFNSSNITEYYSIQSKYVIPCVYKFSVENLTKINVIGTNINHPSTAETKIISTFGANDDTLYVRDTTDFLEFGYLSVPVYKIIPTGVGDNEFRKYEYYGQEILHYTGKTLTTFIGVTRLSSTPRTIDVLNSKLFPNLFPTANQYYLY